MDSPTSLDSLPEELLDKIFARFASNKDGDSRGIDTETLSNISKTCRKFHRIAEPLLYRDLCGYYMKQSGPDLAVVDGVTGGHKLLRTLRERPGLGNYVKTFRAFNAGLKYEVQVLRGPLDEPIIHNILTYARKMEYLDLKDIIAANEEQLQYWMLEYVTLVSTTAFTNLRTLRVSIDIASVSKLLFIFQLPSLEAAHISIIQACEAFPIPRTVDWQKTQSPIKKLSFTNMSLGKFFWRNYHVYGLFALIGDACPSLEFFKLSLAGRDQCQYDHVYEGVTKALSHKLSSGSLRHFELWSDTAPGHICRQTYPDITEIWKSDGVQVEVLTMDMIMLFRDRLAAPMVNPDPVDSAIPRSIQHLTLRHNLSRYTQFKEHGFVKRALFHLLDRIRKYNPFPELRTVTLEMPERIFKESLPEGMLVSSKDMMQDAYLLEKVRLQFRYI